MSHAHRYILLFLVSLMFLSCVQKLDEEKILRERFNTRIAEYKAGKIQECKEKAIDQAEFYVDSLIDTWVGREVIDTIAFPEKPSKPQRPDPILGTLKKFEVN